MTGAAHDQASEPVERMSFRVPVWVQRVGTTSWMFVGMVLALAVLVVFVKGTRTITGPVVVSAFLAAVLVPIVNWLEGRSVKRGLGAMVVVTGLLLVVGGAGWITGVALSGQADALVATLDTAVDEIRVFVDDLPIPAESVDAVDSSARDAAPVVRDGVLTTLSTAIDSAAGLVAGLILGLVTLYYLLKDGPMLTRRWVDSKADRADRDATQRAVDQAVTSIQGYFGGKTALAVVNGVSIAIGMVVLGVPGALAIGVVNFVGAYIPYIGAFIGGGFAVLMALGAGGLGPALAALAVVMVANIVLENLLEPKLLGSSLGLHPLTILLATSLGGLLAGLIGLVLAAPAVAIAVNLKRELTAIGFFADDPVAPGPNA